MSNKYTQKSQNNLLQTTFRKLIYPENIPVRLCQINTRIFCYKYIIIILKRICNFVFSAELLLFSYGKNTEEDQCKSIMLMSSRINETFGAYPIR